METCAQIRKADLARHWGVSPAYVTQVLKRHTPAGGEEPRFSTLEEADQWRAENAPPKPANEVLRQSANENRVEAKKKSRTSQPTTPRAGAEARATATATAAADAAGSPANNGGGEGGEGFRLEHDDGKRRASWGEGGDGKRGGGNGAGFIDVRQYIQPGADFVAVMLRQSEEVPQIAYGLYQRACASGNPAAVSVASGNWADAARNAAAVRTQYLDLQERERNLIPLDLVLDIVGTELQALRSFLLTLGDRYGAKANPDNPALGKAAIEEGVDELLKTMEALPQRVAGETETRATEAAAA